MTPAQFANATIGEIDSLVSGYVRRYQRLEDLFIIHCALPAYRGAYGKKAPTYEQLTAHRHQVNGKVLQMDAKTEAYWREILDEGVRNVKKS